MESRLIRISNLNQRKKKSEHFGVIPWFRFHVIVFLITFQVPELLLKRRADGVRLADGTDAELVFLDATFESV